MVVEDAGNGGGFGDKERENQYWYYVEDNYSRGQGNGRQK